MNDCDLQKKDIVTIILHSINDTQNVIKNIDTKAQVIIGAMVVILVNIEKYAGNNFSVNLSTIFASLAIVSGLFVIYPRIQKFTKLNNAYYITAEQDVNKISKATNSINWTEDLYDVLSNLAKIRETKILVLSFTFLFSALALFFSTLGYIYKICS